MASFDGGAVSSDAGTLLRTRRPRREVLRPGRRLLPGTTGTRAASNTRCRPRGPAHHGHRPGHEDVADHDQLRHDPCWPSGGEERTAAQRMCRPGGQGDAEGPARERTVGRSAGRYHKDRRRSGPCRAFHSRARPSAACSLAARDAVGTAPWRPPPPAASGSARAAAQLRARTARPAGSARPESDGGEAVLVAEASAPALTTEHPVHLGGLDLCPHPGSGLTYSFGRSDPQFHHIGRRARLGCARLRDRGGGGGCLPSVNTLPSSRPKSCDRQRLVS